MYNKLDLVSPIESYLRGNTFNNLYSSYKNYQPMKLNFTSLKDELLFNIGETSFLAHEMNLYLDNYPDNKEALEVFKKYSNISNNLIKEYESKYGPLNVSGSSNNIPFNWESMNFPWEA